MTRRPDPAVVGWVVVLGVAFAVDTWLIRNGHRTLSHVARSSAHSRRVTRMLAGHLTDEIPGDLLALLGKRLARPEFPRVLP